MGDLVALHSVGGRLGCRKAIGAVEWYERGLALEATDPEGAIHAYRRAIAGRPDLADAYNNLGRVHHDRGEVEIAESLYRLAICAGGDVALYWFNLGVAAEDQGRRAEAIRAYERALARDATLADAHYNLARQLERAARGGGDGGAGGAGGQGTTNDLVLRRAVRHLSRYRELAGR